MSIRLSALIQTFRESPTQPAHLVQRLVNAPIAIQVVINDDSGEQEHEWRRRLRPDVDLYVRSYNIHEVRAYNKLARLAAGELLVFLRGNDCLPASTAWLDAAHFLFARMPRLAALGGHTGYVDQSGLGLFGPYPRRSPIPYYIHSHVNSSSLGQADDRAAPPRPIAFMYVPFMNFGPYFVRREPFLQAGGFTANWSAPGEPGGPFDAEMCLRFWLGGWHTCGLYYGRGVFNGVGGHKTRQGVQARARRLAQARAITFLVDSWQAHNATVGARLSEEQGQLLRFPSAREAEEVQLLNHRRAKQAKQECSAAVGPVGKRAKVND